MMRRLWAIISSYRKLREAVSDFKRSILDVLQVSEFTS